MGILYGMVPNILLALGTEQHHQMIIEFGIQNVRMSVM
jgi:hypothetical protein